MFGELVKSIESAFIDFSIRRALYVLFVLALLVGGLLAFDRMTGYSRSHRLDAQLSALERLHALEKAGIRDSRDLSAVYDHLVAQVKDTTPAIMPIWRADDADSSLKFIAGAAIPLLFVLIGLVQLIRGEPGASSVLGGAAVAAAVMGLAAVIVPTVHSLKATLLGVFAAQCLLMFLMVRRYGNRSRAG